MRVFCLNSLDELTPYAEDWERLAGGVPFRSWTWLSNWWRHYGPRDDGPTRTQLATLCVFDQDDTLVGIAPWYIDRSAVRGRVLRFLGSGEVCSDYLGVLCQPGREGPVVEAIADFLVRSALDDSPDALHWDLLKLDGVDAEDVAMAELGRHLAGSGCAIHRRPSANCWRLELPTDWESYTAALGKQQRRTVRRLERQLLDTERVTLHVVTRFDELTRAMDILVDLHQRRRRSLGEPGCFASPRFLAFHRDVVPELLRRGMVQLYWLEIDGRPAAAEYHLASGGVLYVYQAGVEPELLDQQPGNVINLAILRWAIERGYRAYDFLRGDEPYKARFGATPRPCVELQIAAPCPAARWRHNLWLAGNNMKQWIKREMTGTK
ncbi:MAG: GNAT family N-acetyltransferase [Thermoguttaceae bacterium]